MSESIPEDLFAGEPVIEARWRLQNGALPLKNRHLRAFDARGVSNGLSSWARQHIEWTLAEGTLEDPNGVLVIDVDDQGRAVMALAPFEALPPLEARLLLDRVSAVGDDAGQAGQPVESEVLWLFRAGRLAALTDAEKPLSGANSLVADLAQTLDMGPDFVGHADAAGLVCALADGDECFLVSDEHGVVGSSDFAGPVCERFASYYARIIALAKPDKMASILRRS